MFVIVLVAVFTGVCLWRYWQLVLVEKYLPLVGFSLSLPLHCG